MEKPTVVIKKYLDYHQCRDYIMSLGEIPHGGPDDPYGVNNAYREMWLSMCDYGVSNGSEIDVDYFKEPIVNPDDYEPWSERVLPYAKKLVELAEEAGVDRFWVEW